MTTGQIVMYKWSRTSSHPNRRGWRQPWPVDAVMGVMTADRLNVLRSVSIFAGTPDALLTEISAALEELRFPAGARIFSKGDLGESLYIIAEGQVRVHDGERTLSTLHRGDVFGEMAALDPEVRSASITALSDTRLFRLDRGPLYQVMAQRIDVAQGITHVLAQRLRTSLRGRRRLRRYGARKCEWHQGGQQQSCNKRFHENPLPCFCKSQIPRHVT